MSRSFPVALKLEGRACLVVGSSPEAARRARALADSGARVVVLAEDPCDELSAVVRERGLTHHARRYERADLDGKWLAVLADRNAPLAAEMDRDAEALRVFFCPVDEPGFGSYSHMALARSGIVTAAIATEGQAPALGRKLREELQRAFDDAGLGGFADSLAELRRNIPSSSRYEVLGRAVAGVTLQGRLLLPDH